MNCATDSCLLRVISLAFFIFSSGIALGQTTDSLPATPLSTIEVKAYGHVRKLKDVPAAVGFVGTEALNRFSPASVVMAVNTVAGVRMEERSPGSYRFNIRGSSLRSPFGVRNVKVYYNDIPFTDPGGHTYLNGLGFYNIGSIEILKGPGSSLYGAGTGGVLLIEGTAPNEKPGAFVEYSHGSFGLRNAYASVATGGPSSSNKIGFQHQVSQGYRHHSEMQRNVLSWTGNFQLSEKQTLKTTFLYSHHFYETPGALTRTEFEMDARLSRPAGGAFPGALAARASIDQKTFMTGASYTQQFNDVFSHQTVAYGSFTELRNPAIRNYGKVADPHVGGRTSFRYQQPVASAVLNLTLGGEWQQGFSTSTVFKNRSGDPDSLQTADDIQVRQAFLFLQSNLSLAGWELTAGASVNSSVLRFRRTYPVPGAAQRLTLNDQVMPRVALARKFNGTTVYTSVSQGFSPPTSNELLPSGSAVNLSLQAEQGTNFDIGARGTVLSGLTFDVNAFYFQLDNTIVQRRDAGGGELFVNAGKTAQKGIETGLRYPLFRSHSLFRQTNLWLTHTYHQFRYKEFKQLTNDYSGRAMPGTPLHTLAAGVDLRLKDSWSAALTYYQASRIPLNDANSAYASPYRLLGAKISFQQLLKQKNALQLAVGADNLFNQQYSLGNDINAFGGRFYNAAAGRNYFVTLTMQLFNPLENR